MNEPEPGDPASPFDQLLGTEWASSDPEGARVRIAFRSELTQPAGLLHGGVLSSLVESICSYSTSRAVAADGTAAVGQSLSISFLRPISEGSVEITARARHRGRRSWVWEAEVSDGEGRLCAVAQMTIAITPRG